MKWCFEHLSYQYHIDKLKEAILYPFTAQNRNSHENDFIKKKKREDFTFYPPEL